MATDYTRILSLTALTALLLIVSVHLSYSCNEQVCASIVSKCMLTQSCKCDSKNYSCCHECFKCLGHLQLECCSCLGKCEPIFKSYFNLICQKLVDFNFGRFFLRNVPKTNRNTKCVTTIACWRFGWHSWSFQSPDWRSGWRRRQMVCYHLSRWLSNRVGQPKRRKTIQIHFTYVFHFDWLSFRKLHSRLKRYTFQLYFCY